MAMMRDHSSGVLFSPSTSGLEDDFMGLDPNGFRPLAAVDASRHMPDPHMAHMDVSMLVGVPPPPPKTPPPKRNRRPSRPNTPLGEDPGVLMPSSVSRVLAMNAAPRSQENRNGMVPRDTKKTMNIVDERRMAALAMYNSEDLVLDHEESFTTKELLRPVTPSENKPLPYSGHRESLIAESPIAESPIASTRSRGVTSASPTSQVTEPHSNQTALHDAFTEKAPLSSAKTVSSPQPSPLAEKEKQTVAFKKIEQEDKASKKDEKKKGGLFKRFFRRGKGKEKDDAPEKPPTASKHNIPASGTRTSPRFSTPKEPKGVPSMSTPKSAAASQTTEPTPNARSHQWPLKPSIKDNADRVYTVQNSPRDAAGEIESPWGFGATSSLASSTSSGRPMVSEKVATVQAPMPPSPTTNKAAFTAAVSLTMHMQATSPSPSDISFLSGLQTPRMLDPPDEAVYDDPPISFEPEPQSHSNTNPIELTVSASQDDEEEPDEEEPSRVESARSRIADVYEDNIQRDGAGGPISDLPSSLSDERPEIFFSHDEVSVLTGPSFESLHKKMFKSFDPAPAADGLYHDPFGHYFDPSKKHDVNAIDPSETDSLVDEPFMDGLPGHGSLRVDVREGYKTQDPVGESPFHDGTRGSKSAVARHPDPVGDSPMGFVARNASSSATFKDPVGESPVHATPTAVVGDAFLVARKASSSATFKDPVGESPVHATPTAVVGDAFHDPAGSLWSLVTSKVNPASTPSQRGVQSQSPSLTDEDISENVAGPPLQQLTAGYVSDDSETFNAEEKKEDDGDVVERAPPIPSKVVSSKKASRIKETDIPSKVVSSKKVSRIKETDEDMASSHQKQQKVTEQDVKGMSSATRAALKLAKSTENDDKDQVTKPGLKPVSDGRVGSTTKQVVPRLVVNTKDTLKTKRNKFSSINGLLEGKANPTEKKVAGSKGEGEVEKSGFRSGSVTPVAAVKPLTVSAAAFTNAKAVAYLHRIQGEASPRHSWLSSKKKQDEKIIVEAKPPSAKKGKISGGGTPKLKPPSPEDYGAHDPELLDFMSRSSLSKEKPIVPPTPETLLAACNPPALGRSAAETSTCNSTRLFSAYSSKFNGRKPGRKDVPPLAASPRIEALDKRGIDVLLSSTRLPQKPIQADSPRTVFKKRVQVVTASSAISSVAVARGIKLRKNKRIDDIQSGRSTPVILTPKKRPTGGNRFYFVPADESEIKDPIQRAGRRLLSKAAIPIQCAARRFIAKGEAVDRMWALIEIQSYFRRWRCEANLQASIDAATLLQAAFRGWLTRDKVKDMHYCAVQIQRVVRGHLAALRAYDTIYCVVQIQAAVRGFFDRKTLALKQETATLIQATYRGHAIRNSQAKSRAAIAIQAAYRGCKARQGFGAILAGVAIQKAFRGYKARQLFASLVASISLQKAYRGYKARQFFASSMASISLQKTYRGYKARQLFASSVASISLIQTAWRSYSGRIKFQFKIVDIIISQSVVRRWAACRVVRILKDSKSSCFAVKIQKVWRGYSARESLTRNLAACRIQATWRGFHCYTDYIFALVDILVVQRTVRQWLAIKATKEMRRNKAATKIQTQWRRRKAQVTMLFSLVHIIIVQSVARRYLSRFAVRERRLELAASSAVERHRQSAATAIQRVWRGFWGFSHYIIIQYEITKLQSLIRGKLARQSYSLSLGCAIIIQATARQYIAKKSVDKAIVRDAVRASQVVEMRERNASKRIQFWWRIVLDWMKEKKAALTIERFFIHVRREVDREILRREQKKKQAKKEKRRKSRKESEDTILERVWLNTVDEDKIDPYAKTSKQDAVESSRSKSVSRSGAPSPSYQDQMSAGLRHRASSPDKQLVMRHEDAGTPIQRTRSTSSNRMMPPTDAVRMALSEDASEVSNLTTPSVFQRSAPPPRQVKTTRTERTDVTDEFSQEADYVEAESRRLQGKSSRKKKTTDDYIHKYGMQTAPSSSSQHFFSEEAADPSAPRRKSSGGKVQTPSSSRSQIQGTTPRSTPRNQHPVALTPRGSAPGGLPSLPRGQHGAPSPRAQKERYNFYPPVTPSRQKTPRSKDEKLSSSRSHAETADMTSHGGTSHHSHGSSPPPRPDGRGHAVVLMKNYTSPDYPIAARSFEESQEVQYLGEEFGEV